MMKQNNTERRRQWNRPAAGRRSSRTPPRRTCRRFFPGGVRGKPLRLPGGRAGQLPAARGGGDSLRPQRRARPPLPPLHPPRLRTVYGAGLRVPPPPAARDAGGGARLADDLLFPCPVGDPLSVYIGRIDRMLEPFVREVPRDEARGMLRLFLTALDRTVSDSFCHANIGPEATRHGGAGRRAASRAAKRRPQPHAALRPRGHARRIRGQMRLQRAEVREPRVCP